MYDLELSKKLINVVEELKGIVKKDFDNGLFNSRDLKCHDASYYGYSHADDYPHLDLDEEFYAWCDARFQDAQFEFKQYYAYELGHDNAYIGHTSKFYLNDFIYDVAYGAHNFEKLFENIINEVSDAWSWGYDAELEKVVFDYDEEYVEEGTEQIEYAIEDLIEDYEHEIEDMREVAEYLDDFKEGQTDDFADWCAFAEEEARACEEVEFEEAKSLIDLYNITLDTINAVLAYGDKMRKILKDTK